MPNPKDWVVSIGVNPGEYYQIISIKKDKALVRQAGESRLSATWLPLSEFVPAETQIFSDQEKEKR